ncbi:tetratricopeptide repeat protein [Marivivens donghaensis]|uniref:Tetratricopeptide repeat protein n=1 Tax=Marivivens donghaensis TaxID=1699413 RepID=A0ABX0W3P0_9RHOB|nr:tetratricopeptide repeat protein [Marivivens donghaensis]NIY73557.1 tetratricopeptide repeat protein [Marivivens donghaensis]
MNFQYLRTSALVSALALLTPGLVSAQSGEPLEGLEVNAGAYLAAREAGLNGDFVSAAEFYQRTLETDPDNIALMENALASLVGAGQWDAAAPLADRMIGENDPSQISTVVFVVNAIKNGEWEKITAALNDGMTLSPLLDGALEAWAAVDRGQMTDAIALFDEMSKDGSLGSFGNYQKAMALAMVGDFEGAEAVLSDEANADIMRNGSAVLARAQILSQLGRDDEAVAMLRSWDPAQIDAEVQSLLSRLNAGETLTFDRVTSPEDAMSEVFLTIGYLIEDQGSPTLTLIYSRAAQELAPGNTEAILLTARLFESMGQHAIATQVYSEVPAQSADFMTAELGRAESLRAAGRLETAIEVLQALSRHFPEEPYPATILGDYLRAGGQYAEAEAAYTKALDLYGETPLNLWFVYFARGIVLERQDKWDEAEADFRTALAQDPNQPSLLNYLGYSLVEKGMKLDEALDLIERAAAMQPSNGAIIDSLGWALFRLGQYEEAAQYLERATELEATDPVVTDHLGDALWAIGRKVEARFQWQRALSFSPEEEEAERIRLKLELGLDVVLEQEGAAPLHGNRDNN